MNDSFRDSSGRAAVMIALALSMLPVRLLVALADHPADRHPAQHTLSEPEEFGGLDIDKLNRVRIVSATLTLTQVQWHPSIIP